MKSDLWVPVPVRMAKMANSQDSVSFSVGEAFDSYEALEKKLNEYKKAKFVEFWKRDSRTIEVAKKRIDCYHRLYRLRNRDWKRTPPHSLLRANTFSVGQQATNF